MFPVKAVEEVPETLFSNANSGANSCIMANEGAIVTQVAWVRKNSCLRPLFSFHIRVGLRVMAFGRIVSGRAFIIFMVNKRVVIHFIHSA